MFEQYFTLDRIGQLVGRNPATVRTHINRGYVMGQGPRNTSTNKEKGKHERFSFNSLIEFALAYRIEAAGVSLQMAFKYAGEFAHAGGTDLTNMSKGNEVRRNPGMPYHHRHGHTYMGMMAGRSAEVAGRSADLGSLQFHLCRMSGSPDSEPMIVINITKFFAEICAALGQDYRLVLDAAYPEKPQD